MEQKNHYKVLKTNEDILVEPKKEINQANSWGKDLEKTQSETKLAEQKSSNYDKPDERKNNSFSPKFRKEGRSFEKRPNRLQTEKLGSWRRWRGTKGGRRPTSNCLVLAKDEEKKSISFAYAGGKEPIIAFRKCIRQAQKKLINYFPDSPRTIPHDILVSYKATTIFLKPAPPGSGIKAGGSLNKLFKFLEIKDVSAKIIGSRRNKLNVIRAAMMALDKLTGKKYDY